MRIVTHTCSNTEIVCALGLADQIVGCDDHSDYPAEVVDKVARIGPDNSIDVGKVAQLKPDMVLTSNTIPGHDACIAELAAAGLPHLVLEPTHLDHIPRDIRTIAQALDVNAAGDALADEFAAELEALTVGPVECPVPVLVEWWPKPVIVPGRDSWVTQMLDRVGGVNPWGDEKHKSLPITDEDKRLEDVAHIVLSWCGVRLDKYRPEVVKRREAWQSVQAVRDNSIHCISEELLGRPGPRLIQGMRKLRTLCNKSA